MAKVTGPLFSLSARGKLARTLVYSAWKGLATIRQLVIPANPRTAGQVAQRSLLSTAVNAWRSSKLAGAVRTAWDRLAAYSSRPESGFNAFCSNVVRGLGEQAAFTIAKGAPTNSGATVTIACMDAATLEDGTETGSFIVSYGPAEDQLLSSFAADDPEDNISGDIVGFTTGDTIFLRVSKAAAGSTEYDRSGILSLTLV